MDMYDGITRGLNEAIEHAEGKRQLTTKHLQADSLKKLDRKTRQQHILAMIGSRSMTAREIAHRLGFSDLNAVRPRITELVREGRLLEVGRRYDKQTQRNVTVYSANPNVVDP